MTNVGNNVRIVNNSALSQSQNAGLREGSVVVGRVLEKAGSLYTISLAGKMISVRSKENLVPGSIFRGTIKIVDGKKVEIALLKDASTGSAAKAEILESRLASLGLEKNEVSMRLLDFMTTLGMKLDSQKMKKALSKGKSNVEKGTSTSSATLVESSPTASDSDAEALEATEKKSAKKSEIWLLGDENGVDLSDEELDELVLRFLSQSKEQETSGGSRASPTSVYKFNSLEKSTSEDFRHWFVLPFDWDYMKMSGSLKVLEKFPDRIVEKIIIDIDDKYRFFLEFGGNKLKKVTVVEPVETTVKSGTSTGSVTDELRTFLFKNGFPNVEVEGVDGDEKIFSVLKGFSAEV